MLKLLDLFCGAGGAAMGYHRAGFDEIVGVDNHPMPRYPFTFVLADALEYVHEHGHEFDAIHASPPCQKFTAYQRNKKVGVYPDLIEETRRELEESGCLWVIENVPGSPLHDPIILCGSMFDPVMDIRRHRLFETNARISSPMWPCRHKLTAFGRFRSSSKRRPNSRATIEIGSWDEPVALQRKVMGVSWPMTIEELSEAIPPAYTEFIGRQLIQEIKTMRAVHVHSATD